MSRSWADVKKLLDDPYVDADTKEHLLAAYIREEGYVYNQGLSGPVYVDEDRLPSEVRSYTDKYQLGADDLWHGDLDEVYADAEDESGDGYSMGINDDRVETGRTTIEGMQPPVEGSSSGVEKSDEIFEAARSSLRLWEDFVPINEKVPGDCLYQKINLETDIKKRFDEQVGISFKNFLDDAKRLRDAHTELAELNSSSETELNNLYKEWTGAAANASYQYYSEKLVPNVTDLLEYLQTAPDMIDTAVTNIFTACKDKANDIIAIYQNCRGTVGSATPEMAAKVVKLAGGDFDSQDEVLEVAAWVDSVCGSNLESTMRADDCGLNDENKEYTIRECKKWIRDSFNPDLHETMYVTFKQACDDAFDLVNTHYETLNTYLAEYENKFTAAGSTQQPPGAQNPNQQQQPPGTQNPPPVNTPPPSSSTPPGSSTQPGSYTPPPISTPPASSGMPDPSSLMPPGSSTDPSSAGGTTPSGSTTMPAGIGTPGSSLPGAIDPATGLPIPGAGAGMTPSGGVPKEVTIKDGNRTITVGQPDMRGRSKVTVDDGTGEPREYEVDFTPDEPGETYEDGVIKAGQDGKAVIQDGDAAITLEQVPGQSSQMKMTVDDGTPTDYDFDFDAGSDVPSPGLSDTPGSSSLGGDPSGGGAGGGGLGGGAGGGGGGSFGGAETPGASGPSTTPGPGAMVGAQAPDTGNQAGGAAAAAASAGAGAAGGAAAGGAPMGGMPMGGMGQGGQGGGDQARQSKWRTTGSLFDDDKDPAANFSGIVGRDPAEKPKTPKR
jgi:uncharacterized protein YukE